MLDKLLSESIYNAVFALAGEDEISELRLRAGKPLCYAKNGRYFIIEDCIVTAEDIERAVAVASGHSVYAANDSIARGYLVCGKGYRLGICGEGVLKDGKLFTLKNITSLCIRVPHEVKGCCDKLRDILKKAANTLIISPPGLGKTTMLRECARILSRDKNVLVLDERGELIPVEDGQVAVETGNMCDVACNIPKITAYETLVRTMRPDIIITDEVFGEREVQAICDISRCGVTVFASLHAGGIGEVYSAAIYRPLLNVMRYFVVLEDIGRVAAVYDGRKNNA